MDLTLGFADAKINSVVGTKASEGTLNVANGKALGNIAVVKNVTVNSADGSNFAVKSDIFDGVKLNGAADVSATSVKNVEFGSGVNIKYAADKVTYALAGCTFSTTAWVSVTGGIEKATTPSKVTYQWNINTNTWDVVTGAIYPANAGDTGIEVSANDVAVSGGAITKGADKIGDHKVFTIVTGSTVTILPENCALSLDKCKYGNNAINDANINSVISVGGVEPSWLAVTVDGTAYSWRKSTWGWVLVK